MNVDYITNLNLGDVSGGGSGVNYNSFSELSKRYNVKYIGPIEERVCFVSKVVSKVYRSIGCRGDFFFFSGDRLSRISKTVKSMASENADFYFFHGPTSWIAYEPPGPYFVYLDACFKTYINIFHDPSQFKESDLDRITTKEAQWLEKASGIFFRSKWALTETAKHYGISKKNMWCVGRGGNLTIPERDYYQGDKILLFAGLNFELKGGHICYDAFSLIKEIHPNVKLHIIGASPPNDILNDKDVIYHGFLNKNISSELHKLQNIFAKSFILVHPTSFDINPTVITEAAYFGTPAISSNSFAIPELIIHGKTGYIIDIPLNSADIANYINNLINNPIDYNKMRYETRRLSIKKHTWKSTFDLISKNIAARIHNETKVE